MRLCFRKQAHNVNAGVGKVRQGKYVEIYTQTQTHRSARPHCGKVTVCVAHKNLSPPANEIRRAVPYTRPNTLPRSKNEPHISTNSEIDRVWRRDRKLNSCKTVSSAYLEDSPTLEITSCLQHVLTMYSEDTKRQGLTIILDARKGPWKIARSCIRQITATLNADELAHFIVLRPENFLDKQRVENCTNTPKDGQVLFIPRSRLNKLVDQSQLPLELGGMFIYNHDLWMENRMKIEEYLEDGASALKNLDDLHQHLLRGRLMRPSEVEITLNNSSDLIDTTKIMSHDTLEKGRLLLEKIESDNRNRKFDSESDSMLTPQDILDALEQLETMISDIRKKQSEVDDAWIMMQRNFLNTKDLSLLEEGIVKVTNWILGPAESLLNSKQKVGYDVASAEELRREHEAIELQCWDTYGAYAELVHKVDSFARDESLTIQQKDLISQKDFMDFVCRSFATRVLR
ncbi:hypothetical protein Trydic_g880 [Trypoxylus dichotomus]